MTVFWSCSFYFLVPFSLSFYVQENKRWKLRLYDPIFTMFFLYYSFINPWMVKSGEHKKSLWKIECFLEDLFLGGQLSIILGYRRLSVKFSWFLILVHGLYLLVIFHQLLIFKRDLVIIYFYSYFLSWTRSY